MMGSGGATGCQCPDPNETCDVTGACVCNQTDAQACAASGVSCGTTAVNECNQKVSCVCPAGYLCNTTTHTCSRCVSGTGGIIAAGASDAIICPLTPDTTQ